MNDSEVRPLTIVGIGASAGGLEAFRGFFDNMPPDSGMAFVVILHLPADRPSMLPDILARWTSMRVRPAEDGMLVEPNTVYVPPPHATTVLRDGRLHITPTPPNTPREHRPVDGFFDTLASSQRERAVGIVLSGTGTDGALGLKAIRSCGGLTIVQGTADDSVDHKQGDGPQFGGMPAGAIATGAIDLVTPVQAMPGHLLRLLKVKLEAEVHGDTPEDTEKLRLEICAILRTHVGHDFSGYKDKTFLRRVNRRMQVRDIPKMADYVEYLRYEHDEGVLLFRELLIRVTSFFRDGDAFDMIEHIVIPRLFEGRHADNSIRIWVPGCATGEEAYSLGMLMLEHAGRMRGGPKIQIFATDIDEPAIGTARMGRYPTVLLEGLSDQRRERFFTKSDSGYVVSRELRDVCTFSAHSLVRDPPFSRMDLISCRNLLIYLDAQLQAAILPAFHYSLAPAGILVLGISESTSRHENLFQPIDKAARIFEKRNVRSPPLNLNRDELDRIANPGRRLHDGAPRPANSSFRSENGADAAASAPSQMFEARYRTSLGGRLRAGAGRLLAGLGQGAELKRLLEETRTELANLSEQHATALEELRSSNEELHSVNEELQSTNEELETSKEEIQSVNEELHTVNAQLSEKVDELDRANSDLRNLFDSTQIATVFLDRHLIVRSFTNSVASIYNLIPSDVGRPLTDIVSTLRYDELRQDVMQVLDTLMPLERRISDLDGATHYILRILPYRAPDSTVSGTLATFLDVTSIVRAEQHQRLLVDELNHRVKNMLTVVISLASQTARRSGDLAEFQEAFMGRVRALSASYALLSRENWVSVALREIVEEELNPFAAAERPNVHVAGDDVQLAPAGALALGMAIHELATNAVKYGSLSAPEGSVTVTWRVENAAPEPALVIAWHERGGPVVGTPGRAGFGTTLVRRSLSGELGGEADFDFRPEGLCAVLRAPLARIARADMAAARAGVGGHG